MDSLHKWVFPVVSQYCTKGSVSDSAHLQPLVNMPAHSTTPRPEELQQTEDIRRPQRVGLKVSSVPPEPPGQDREPERSMTPETGRFCFYGPDHA